MKEREKRMLKGTCLTLTVFALSGVLLASEVVARNVDFRPIHDAQGQVQGLQAVKVSEGSCVSRRGVSTRARSIETWSVRAATPIYEYDRTAHTSICDPNNLQPDIPIFANNFHRDP